VHKKIAAAAFLRHGPITLRCGVLMTLQSERVEEETTWLMKQ
jgi:hypothetical protein